MQRIYLLLISIFIAANAFAATPVAISRAESLYVDLNDATAAISTIESGYSPSFAGKNLSEWKALQQQRRKQLKAQLGSLSIKGLSAEDERAVKLMREASAGSPETFGTKLTCKDARRTDLKYPQLSAALYACFGEVGNNLEFEGKRISRGSTFGKLEEMEDAKRRKAVFLAISPLYEAINGKNESNSPYRRLIKLAVGENAAKQKSEAENAARTVGVKPKQVEQWLEQILDNWKQVSGDEQIEPWDYRYRAGTASRQLDAVIPRADLQRINERYYQDLGADLNALGVICDIEPRAGKSPVAYTDFARRGRMLNGKWQPTIARVLASYGQGGLGNLNEYIHENGHAVQISAIHTRPAFMDWGDTLFVEAFADVPSWSTYDPEWQQKYLGRQASVHDSLVALYSGVMLDVAWSLFEIRMLASPDADPNQIWTDITSRYLHIVPHPELSWWAVRGQLVDAPGYMVNYGLGAVVTADLRARIHGKIGPFNTGNSKWYPWLTENLLRFGAERETADLLRDFLGRPVSPEALVSDIRGMGSRQKDASSDSVPKSQPEARRAVH
jgi:hypothetical protein